MAWNRDKERKAGRAITIGGSIYGIIFALAWNVIAVSMGAGFMLIFGIPILIFMIFRLVVCIQKANEDKKPKDPWDQSSTQQSYTQSSYSQPRAENTGNGFCPYCGGEIKDGFAFCPKCGRRMR